MSDEPTRGADVEMPVAAASPSPDPSGTSALVPVPGTGPASVVTGTVAPTSAIDLEPAATASVESLESPDMGEADRTTAGDPFPREAWATLTSHAAGYLRLTVALLRDPAVSKHRRAALLAAAAYFASPIDLIPGIVPVLGQVDDLAVAMLAIRLALNALEPSRRQMHLAAAGLSDETLHEDILAAGRLGAWAARTGVRAGVRVGRGAVRFTVQGGRTVAALAMRGGRSAVRRAAPVLDQTSPAAEQASRVAGRATSTVRQVAGTAASRAGEVASRATSARRRLTERVGRQPTATIAPASSSEGASESIEDRQREIAPGSNASREERARQD